MFSEERNWRQWADEVFVHILSPNVYRTLDESYKTFSWFSKVSESVKSEKCNLNDVNKIKNYGIIFNLDRSMGGVFPNMGATINSERGCDGNVVNREET